MQHVADPSGLAKGCSGCIGLQIDGPGFNENLVDGTQ